MNSLSINVSKAVVSAATALFFLGAALLCSPSMSAAKHHSSAVPDFAYPKTVEKNSAKNLEEALSARDWSKAMVAAIQNVTAQNLVSQENLTLGLSKIDSIADIAPSGWRPAFLLLEADICSSLYSNFRGNADARQLPLDSIPANPKEWSRDMFAVKVLELCKKAMEYEKDLVQTPISQWKSFLDNSAPASSYGMNVGEFILWKCTGLLDIFSDEDQDVIPFFSAGVAPVTPIQKCRALRNDALDAFIAACASRRQPLLQAEGLARRAQFAAYSLRPRMLVNALQQVKDTEGQQLILRSLQPYVNTEYDMEEESPYILSLKEYLGMIRSSIGNFPKGRYVNALKNILAGSTSPSADVRYDNQYLSSSDINMDVTLRNCTSTWILVYDYSKYIGAKESPTNKNMAATCRLVKTVEVKADGTPPFSASAKAHVGQLPAGTYAVVASSTPNAKGIYPEIANDRWHSPFTVSDIAVMSLDCLDGTSKVFVVEGNNGRPIEGATVKVYTRQNYRQPQTLVATLTTDNDGSVSIAEKNVEIKAEYKGSKASTNFRTYVESAPDTTAVLRAGVLADRSIYHPGDSVGAAVIAYTSKLRDLSLSPGSELEVTLLDANGKEVAKKNVVTDRFGRCAVSFRIPDEGLLGSWSLAAYGKDKKWLGNTNFHVADYVAPTFFITADNSGDEYEAGDSVRIRGQVITYSGMPVADAKVDFTVNYTPPMRWFCRSYASYSSTVTADADGKYTISLPTANLKDTQFERGVFTVNLSATSPAGETQTGPSQRFAVGREYSVYAASQPGRFEISDSVPVLNFFVNDMLGRRVTRKLNYTLVNSATRDTVAAGTFMSPALYLPSAHYPSAKYDINVSLADDKKVSTESSVIFWRKSDTSAPAGVTLWVPQTSVRPAPGSSSVNAVVGSGESRRWLPLVISGANKVMEVKWLYVEKDNLTVHLPAPAGEDAYHADIAYMSDLKVESADIDILPAVPADTLGIVTESFRDKVSAGDVEHWKFRFRNRAGNPGELPAMAVMTDAALNHLQPFRWDFRPYFRNSNRITAFSLPWIGQGMMYFNMKNVKYLSCDDLRFPSFNDYGQNWGLGFHVVNEMYFPTAATLSGSMARGVANSHMKRAAMDSAAPAAADGIQEMESPEVAFDEGSLKETIVMGMGAPSNTDVGASDTDLRESEYPLAFFMPYLTTDADGVVDINFTVPNFNTTWQLQVLGYDESLQTACKSLETVASKPVMVSTHSPRFVRTGDVVDLTATIFNNTGETVGVKGRIELVNLLTGRLIAARYFEQEEVKALASRLVAMSWTVPSDVSSVGFRAYAEADGHRDGEQALLPVLPASSPLTESTPFWLAPGQGIFEIKLPNFKNTDQVTLQYCDNPAWCCLTALPAIMQTDSKSVTAKMAALYGNAMAYNLISSDASLKKGLEVLLSDRNSQFAALKSNLEKDGSIKIAELSNTPWVNNAESETLRMSRLSTLLDNAEAENTVSAQIDELAKLQTPEGGWSWCPDMMPSPFITRTLLGQFAPLYRSGAMKSFSAADPMVKAAIRYVDGETWNEYSKYHKKDESLAWLLDWLYVRSAFSDDMLPSGGVASKLAPVYSRARADIAKEWKSLDIRGKAMAALLLWRSGSRKTSLEILESLRQFASESPDKGVWFDNLSSSFGNASTLRTTTAALRAFSEIQPANSLIDGLRQWLVLSRQMQDWGKERSTVETVDAILTSGSDWTRPTDMRLPEFQLRAKPVLIPEAAALTGAFTVTLDAKQASGKKLKISRAGSSPAWGGVISQYEAPILDVQAAEIPNLSIRKQIVALVDDGNGSLVPKEGVTLCKGMKVRVTLTIANDRAMDYMALSDERSACLEPADQLSHYTSADGVGYYKEVRDSHTNLYIEFLPKGHHVISYDCTVSQTGTFSCGIATVQSQYSPLIVAHSGGSLLKVVE